MQLEEVLNERADEEMEVSDTEEDYMGNLKKKSRIDSEDKASLAAIKVNINVAISLVRFQIQHFSIK